MMIIKQDINKLLHQINQAIKQKQDALEYYRGAKDALLLALQEIDKHDNQPEPVQTEKTKEASPE